MRPPLSGTLRRRNRLRRRPGGDGTKVGRAGAEFLHVVDLDGALAGDSVSAKAIAAVCAAVDLPVQTGGGVRTLSDIEKRLSWGVNRVILGTIAVKEPHLVAEAVVRFGAKKSSSVSTQGRIRRDARLGTVSARGAVEFGKADAGCRRYDDCVYRYCDGRDARGGECRSNAGDGGGRTEN